MHRAVNTLELGYQGQREYEGENNFRREILFRNNKKMVVETIISGDTVLTKEIPYNEHNSRDGIAKTFHNGMLKMALPYKKGWKDGLAQVFNEEGIIEKEIPYKRDLKHGIQKEYDCCGNLFAEIPYERGRKQGIKKWYSECGKVMKRVRYNNDQRDDSYKYEYCPYEDDSLI